MRNGNNRRGKEKTRDWLYETMFEHKTCIRGVLGLSAVSGLILEECRSLGLGPEHFALFCERVAEVDSEAINSSYVVSAHPKRWNYHPTKLEVRYFVTGWMKDFLGVTRGKFGKHNNCYWISPLVKRRIRNTIICAESLMPSVRVEEIEDSINMTMSFVPEPVVRNRTLDFIKEPIVRGEAREVVGVLDFFVPGLVRVVAVR